MKIISGVTQPLEAFVFARARARVVSAAAVRRSCGMPRRMTAEGKVSRAVMKRCL